MYPDYPQEHSENLDQSQVIFGQKQSIEQTERCVKNMNLIKKKFNFCSVPQVVVLDKNQQVVVQEASDTLLKLHPEVVRQIWIEVL